MATGGGAAPLFGQRPTKGHQRAALKDDKFARHGRLLMSVAQLAQQPQPLERLMGVCRLAISFLADVVRSSGDFRDTPITILGHHSVCRRQLVAREADGGKEDIYVQELCTFDALEGPKSNMGQQGTPVAVLHFMAAPTAHARSKRLGNQLSVKVDFNGTNRVHLLTTDEVYTFGMPALVLLDPLAPECTVAFKGELAIHCPQTGFSAIMSVAKDGTVSGTIERQAEGGGSKRSSMETVGTFSGAWTGAVAASCPALGLEGTVFDARGVATSGTPGASAGPVLSKLTLAKLGPMALPKLWSSIFDALLYNEASAARGGKAAVQLARDLPRRLTGLSLDRAATRDVATATAEESAAAAAVAGGLGSGAQGGVQSGSESDVDEFDRAVAKEREAKEEGGAQGAGDDRALPPAYKAQHEQGRRLTWQLHYTLVSMGGTFKDVPM